MRSGRTRRDKTRRTIEAQNHVEGEGRAVLNRQRTVKVAIAPLEMFLRRVRDGLGLVETELVICLVTDAEIARMNLAFRKKRGPTDVLSFPARKLRKGLTSKFRRGGALAAEGQRANRGVRGYLGDIAISPATARRNAKSFGRSLSAELRILMLHGVLHLLGYDHEVDGGQMDRLEAKLRRRFGVA
jgi:probable rRNA maturation factor